MKIVHINMDFLPSVGGAQMSVHQLALGQTEAGHDVTVLTNRKSARQMKGVLPYEVVPAFHRTSHMFRATDGWLKKAFFEFQVNWRSRRGRFDICHLHGAMPEGNFIEAFQKAGSKVVMTLRGDDIGVAPQIGYGARLDPAKDAEIRRRVTQSDAMIGLAESWGREIATMGAAPESIHVISNGIRLELFEKPGKNRAEVRASYGLDDEKVVIASIGRNHPVKGYDIIPPVVEQLAKQGKDFVWVLIGPESDVMDRDIADRGLQEYIRTCPPIRPSAALLKEAGYLLPLDEMIAFLKAVDIVVIPSLSEVCCNGALESMAAGTALVGSDIPGIRFILKDGENGLSFPVGNADALSLALARLMDDPSLRARLAQAGRDAVAGLSWKNIVERHIALYESLL